MSADRQRERLVEAMVAVAAERGFAHASVDAVVREGRVSRRTFYEQFDSLEQCFAAVLQDALQRSSALIAAGFRRERTWQGGVREALAELLVFFDANPVLARVWLIEAVAAGAWAFEWRERSLGELRALVLDAWRERTGANPPTDPGRDPAPAPDSPAVVGAMAAVIAVVHTHLLTRRPEPLLTLLPSLVELAAGACRSSSQLAFELALARERVAQVLAGPYPPSPLHPTATIAGELPSALRDPRAHRARAVLAFVAANPGAANVQVAAAAGIASRTQASALLRRLSDLGLIEKQGWGAGYANAWRATDAGARAACALPHGCPT